MGMRVHGSGSCLALAIATRVRAARRVHGGAARTTTTAETTEERRSRIAIGAVLSLTGHVRRARRAGEEHDRDGGRRASTPRRHQRPPDRGDHRGRRHGPGQGAVAATDEAHRAGRGRRDHRRHRHRPDDGDARRDRRAPGSRRSRWPAARSSRASSTRSCSRRPGRTRSWFRSRCSTSKTRASRRSGLITEAGGFGKDGRGLVIKADGPEYGITVVCDQIFKPATPT